MFATFGRRLAISLLPHAASVLVVCAQPANPLGGAAAAGYTVSPNSSAILRMPELKTAPAPAWVKAGLRITGDRLDGNMSPDEKRRIAAHGIDQIDVIAVLPDAVVIEVTQRLFMPPANVLTSVTPPSGLVTTPGDAGEVWVHPDVFHKYMNLNVDGVTSAPADYRAAGKTFHAVAQTVTGAKGRTTSVRDTESGLLLHTSMTVNDGPDQVASQTTLLAVRQVKTPWSQGRVPRALEGIHRIVYEGSQDTSAFGAVSARYPLRVVLKVVGRGPGFVQLERTGSLTIGGLRNDLGAAPLVTGPAQLMPLAVEPDDLAKLRQGQELDTDPVTKIVTAVTFVGRDRGGKDVVVITAAAPGAGEQQAVTTYDAASGVAIGSATTMPHLNQVTRLSLAGKE